VSGGNIWFKKSKVEWTLTNTESFLDKEITTKIKEFKKTTIQPKIGNLIHVLSTYSSINPYFLLIHCDLV